MTYIVLVRHGQTALNRVPSFRGQADIPLNAVGRAQAKATARRIAADWRLDAIYTSPLQRSRKTAEALAHPFGLVVQDHPELIDINFGKWQGRRLEDVRARWPKALEEWDKRPHEAQIPDGETLADFRRRVMGAVHEIVARHPHAWVGIVGHSVVNRVILLGALGLPNAHFWRLAQKNCAVNLLRFDDGEFQLLLMNDISHLRNLAR
jgi:broad specificity phosphatase PhoE